MPEPIPTEIRGVLYPSMTAAAKALGVHLATIWAAAERGTLDHVGLGAHSRRNKPCYINGQRWPSQAAAARAIGVRRSSIGKALGSGRSHVRIGGKGAFV